MALVKSKSTQQQPSATDPQVDEQQRSIVPEQQRSVAPEQPLRRGTDFGQKTNSVSADTYVKLRFSDSPDIPETWFKLNVYPNGVHAFEPTTREHPVVLLMNKGDSKLRMYHLDNASNFDEVGPKRFEGVLAEIQVRKRRDSTPENPQMFMAGLYFAEEGRNERELRGNLVGAQSKALMSELSLASYAEWKAARPARENDNMSAAIVPKVVELVAGQELDFGI